MPASGSSSELSSHQMAIHSHPGVQKMHASGISSELSAHQMVPAGAISGHGNDYAPLGNGVLLFLVPGLALSFLVLVYRSSTSRFEVCVLQKLSTRTVARVFQLRPSVPPCGMFPRLLFLSLTVQMYDVYCGMSVTIRSWFFPLIFRFLLPTRSHCVRLHRHLELCNGP